MATISKRALKTAQPLGTPTPEFFGGYKVVDHTLALPKIPTVPESGTAENIASAYAGEDYGKALMLSAIRGGYEVSKLRRDTFECAALMAAKGYPGFTLNMDGSVYTKVGKGKTLNNDFSMAAAAIKFRFPELGESLSGWYASTRQVEVEQERKITKVDSAQIGPDSTPTKPVPESGTKVEPKNTKAVPDSGTKVEPKNTKAVPDSGTKVEPLKNDETILEFTPKVDVDNVAQMVALIDDALGDDELSELIFELQVLQAARNTIRTVV